MEYIHAVMMLHCLGKNVDEKNVTKVLEAAGAEVDEARVKALSTALDGVDIDEAIETAAVPTFSAAEAEEREEAEKKKEAEEEKEEKKEEEKEEIAGLGELFG